MYVQVQHPQQRVKLRTFTHADLCHRFVSQWSLRDKSTCATYRATPIYLVHVPLMLLAMPLRLKTACVTVALAKAVVSLTLNRHHEAIFRTVGQRLLVLN